MAIAVDSLKLLQWLPVKIHLPLRLVPAMVVLGSLKNNFDSAESWLEAFQRTAKTLTLRSAKVPESDRFGTLCSAFGNTFLQNFGKRLDSVIDRSSYQTVFWLWPDIRCTLPCTPTSKHDNSIS